MGSLCSRPANETDPFAQPGRVVGTGPAAGRNAAAPRAPLPAKTNWKATPGRTLGVSASTDGAGRGNDEARANAAIAAQVSHAENPVLVSVSRSDGIHGLTPTRNEPKPPPRRIRGSWARSWRRRRRRRRRRRWGR